LYSAQREDEKQTYVAIASEESREAEIEPELVSDKMGRRKKTKILGTKVENPADIKATQVLQWNLLHSVCWLS
jgi:hypothetical protein